MPPTTDPRLTSKTRARIKNHWRKQRTPWCQHPHCKHPNTPIDYDAPPGTTFALDIDEITPRADGGDPEDLTNTRPTHATCNRAAGAHHTNTRHAHRTRQRPDGDGQSGLTLRDDQW